MELNDCSISKDAMSLAAMTNLVKNCGLHSYGMARVCC